MEIFASIGVSANLQGYQYLKDAIMMTIENPKCVNRVTKLLYPKIAEKMETTPCRVERGIRHALENAYTKGKLVNLNKILGVDAFSEKEKPTNTEFVALVADVIKLEYANN